MSCQCSSEDVSSASITRRRLLQYITASILAGTIGEFVRPRSALAFRDDRCMKPSQDGPLVIDAHCHIFNAADIPIRNFILNSQVDEFKRLKREILANGAKGVAWIAEKLGQAAQTADAEIKRISGYIHSGNPQALICEEFKHAQNGLRIIGRNRNISIDTVAINESLLITQPRYKNLALLFSAYPNVHLFTPAMVDLFMGAGGSDLPIPNQIELMSDLIVATRGRMLPFVPFDPMRELKFQQARDKQTWQPFKLVTDAIEKKGFIGVKLYPPMGFAPQGNKMRACPNCPDDNFFGSFKDDDNLYQSFRDRYGDAIDDQIRVLLKYCARNGVPVMAHANNSNMANGACVEHVAKGDYLGSPSQWREALQVYGIDTELRLNLAHFGRIDEIYAGKASRTPLNNVDGKRIAEDLTSLISEDNKIYADLANFGFAVSSHDILQNKIRSITANGSNTVSKKLLYGSDWHMLADYERWPSYFGDISRIIDDDYKARFFGLNAVDFLGLKKGEQSRNRIDAFFRQNQISRENNNLPAWVDLVDAIT